MDLETSFEDEELPKKKAEQAYGYGQLIKRKKKKAAKGIDHLSNLPDELIITILSFLPTHITARTSVLCRRFRHLWKAAPSLQFISPKLPSHHHLIALVNCVLCHRHPSHSLFSLHLDLKYYGIDHIGDSTIRSLFSNAFFLSLHHLTIEGSDLFFTLPRIFSISSLKSLSLDFIEYRSETFPSGFTLPFLRRLSLRLFYIDSARINQLVSELCSLEDLHLEIHGIDSLSLSSQTIRNLELIIVYNYSKFKTLELFLPSLESIHLEKRGFFCLHQSLSGIHLEVPLLKRAVIFLAVNDLSHLSIEYPKVVGALKKLLKCISHVEELSLHVKDKEHNEVPVCLGTRKRMPKFPSLKRLDVGLCFHEYNIRAVIMMLHNCPALESLNLKFYEIRKVGRSRKGRQRKEWEAKLLHNANGNYYYLYLRNLNIQENRLELRKFMGNQEMSI
ncbi:F-box/RNI-like/FBD-like domains-containing protein [Rhynchospora pubera]|uniref:F-box/RNI-like/FBD-like domains-containing protein n=1 Tax=Rhynchospora pubera TaxID=906938 RepID=A0AAV8CGS1_9POAL|nr:F-box/RNI-like/FBD-like domains-containing protein [Rhynchospora pubera]